VFTYISFPPDSIQNVTIAQCLKRISKNTKPKKELGHILLSEEVLKFHFFYIEVQTNDISFFMVFLSLCSKMMGH
jgi:hypothetical protein